VRLASIDDTWAAASFRRAAEKPRNEDRPELAVQTPARRFASR